MPLCQNCSNRTSFRLVVEHALPVGSGGTPSTSLLLECSVCDSTAVEGDPLAAFAGYLTMEE